MVGHSRGGSAITLSDMGVPDESRTVSATPSITTMTETSVSGGSQVRGASIARLVYGQRDVTRAGYVPPTSSDIPQIRLPRVTVSDESAVERYLAAAVPDMPFDDETPEPEVKLPALDTVPAVFFAPDFALDNERVFDSIVGVPTASGSIEEDVSDGLLHDKLSWYVDIVEMHLIAEIEGASGRFFGATSSFQDIETRAATLRGELAAFRESLGQVQDGFVKPHMATGLLRTRLDENIRLSGAMDQLAAFIKGVNELNIELPTAEDDMRRLRELSKGPFIDLLPVISARPYLEKLEKTGEELRTHNAESLSDALMADLRRKLSAESPESEVSAELSGVAQQLLPRAGNSEDVVQSFTGNVEREIKTVIKRHLPPASSGSDGEDAHLARLLHYLGAQEAENMFKGLYSDIQKVLILLRGYQKLLISLAPSPAAASIVDSAVHAVDGRITRVLRVRKDATAVLSVSRFVRWLALTRNFIEDCERATGQTPPEMTDFVVAQMKLYCHTLQNDAEQRLATALDTDIWRKDEVSPLVQQAVDVIVEAGALDPSIWLAWARTDKPLVEVDHEVPVSIDGKKRPLNLFVDSESFFVSRGTTEFLKITSEYAPLITLLPPSHAADVAMTWVELVREYNARVHRLILGFGATKSAGLKHISVRHLVFGCENLRCVRSIVGYVARLASRHLPQDRGDLLTMQLAAATDSLNEHQAEIRHRLVKLMANKIQETCHLIAAQDWSRPPPSVDGTANFSARPYMIKIVKDTQTVARAVEDTLPSSLAQAIMADIFGAYKPRLLEAYAGARLSNQSEKDSMLSDLDYFRKNAGHLCGADNVGEILYESVDGFAAPTNGPDLLSPRRSMEAPRRSSETPRISSETPRLSVESTRRTSQLSLSPSLQPVGVDSAEKKSLLSSSETTDVLKRDLDEDEHRPLSELAGHIEAEVSLETEATARADEKAEAEDEAKEKTEAKTKANSDAESKASAEAEEEAMAKAESEANAKAEAEAKAKAEAEAKVKAEAEAKVKAEAEAKVKAEAEAKVKAEAEAKAKAEAEAKAKAEAEAKAKAEAEAKAKAEAEAKAKAEAEAKAKAEAEAKAKAEAEAKAKAEADAKAKAEADAKAKAEADAKAKAEADAKAKAEADAKANSDAESKASAEAEEEAMAKAEAEAKAKAEAEAKAKAEAEAKAKAEAEAKAKAEAEAKAKAEAEAKAKAEAEAKAKAEAEAKAKAEAEAKAKAEAEAKAKAEAEAQAAAKAKEKAESRAKAEAEAKAKAKEKAEAEERTKAEAEAKERAEAEAKERAEAEAKAKAETEVEAAERAGGAAVKSSGERVNSGQGVEILDSMRGIDEGAAPSLESACISESNCTLSLDHEPCIDSEKDKSKNQVDVPLTEANQPKPKSKAKAKKKKNKRKH